MVIIKDYFLLIGIVIVVYHIIVMLNESRREHYLHCDDMKKNKLYSTNLYLE